MLYIKVLIVKYQIFRHISLMRGFILKIVNK